MSRTITASGRTIALCYGRKSVVRTGTDYISIEAQSERVIAEAVRRGWTPVWHEDVDRSGRSESARAQWLALKSRLGEPNIAAVIVYRLDRAARSVRDMSAFIELCDENGVAFITADGIVDTSHTSALRTMFVNMLSAVAQLESDIASERMLDYCARKDKAGIRHGKAPFGIRRTGEGYDAVFQPTEDAHAVVRCLQVYAAGMSYDTAPGKLNDEGVKWRGRDGASRAWGREAVRTVVGNVLVYAGYHIPNTGFDAKHVRVKLTGEGDYVERWAATLGAFQAPAVTPIIDRSLANAVIERRYRNQFAGKPARERPYLLAPIAFWRGQKLRGKSREYGRFYATQRAGIQIDADRAEAQLIARLAGLQIPPEMFAHVRAFLLLTVSSERIAALRERVVAADRKLTVLADLILDAKIDRDEYDRRHAEHTREKRIAEAELARPTEVETSLRALADLGAMIGLMRPDMQKRNIHRLFDRIELGDDGSVVAAVVRPWVAEAFRTIAAAIESSSNQTGHIVPKVGKQDTVCPASLPPGLTWWMSESLIMSEGEAHRKPHE